MTSDVFDATFFADCESSASLSVSVPTASNRKRVDDGVSALARSFCEPTAAVLLVE